MKITLSALLLLTASASPLFGVPIGQWTFETSPPADLLNNAVSQSSAADVGSGAGTGIHVSTGTNWTTPAGNGSANSWSSTNWASGDYWQFQVSTLGYTDITVSWDQISSGTGPRDFGLFYSINGSSFAQYPGNHTVAQTVWTSFSENLSSISGLNNANSVLFRLQVTSNFSANNGSIGTSGTSRIDNFTVSGTAIPEGSPGMAGLAGACVLMAVFRHRRMR